MDDRVEAEVGITTDTAGAKDIAAGVGTLLTATREDQNHETFVMDGDDLSLEMKNNVHTEPAGEMTGAIRRDLDMELDIVMMLDRSEL